MLKQGYDKDRLTKSMRRILSNNIIILNKFGFKSGLEVCNKLSEQEDLERV